LATRAFEQIFWCLKKIDKRKIQRQLKDKNMSTLVLTSLNPHANINYQLHCFDEWKKIGYEIKSHNSDVECELLFKHGVQKETLNRIRIEDTAEQLFGKPIPRILPLLESALASPHDNFILTNSDIFPAHRKVISESLARSFQSAAFTRTECLDLALCDFHSQYYYRGGLDLFWFTKTALMNLLEKLRQSPVAERMTFGVPGWDFYLCHILSNNLNTPIIDGSIFIHQSHRTAYSRIDEFEHYAADMINSGQYAAQEPTALAHKLSTFIRHQCSENSKIADFLKHAFYKQPDVRVYSNPEAHDKNRAVLKQFAEQLDGAQVNSTFSDTELEIFTNKQDEGGGWPAAISLANSKNGRHTYKFYRLQLLLLALLCMCQTKTRSLNLKYPEGNLHVIALKQIVQSESGLVKERNIFDLFASEIVDHGIVNQNLMKYLFTSAHTAEEIALFFCIISICKQGLRHA